MFKLAKNQIPDIHNEQMFLVTGASNMQRKWCGIENLL